MEPLMLTALFVWGLMRYAGTELMATARGTEPPRVRERRERAGRAHERAMAKIARRSGPTVGEALGQRIAQRIADPRGSRPPGPARRALGAWWADSWDYATDRRRHRHQRAKAGDLGRQRAARAARDWLARRRGSSTSQDPPRTWADAEVINDPPEDIVDAEIVEDPPTPEPTPTPDPTPSHPRTASDPTADPPDGGPTDLDPAANPADPDPTATDSARPDPTAPDTEPQHEIESPLASIHLIRKEIPMNAATPHMTSGETLDPASAAAFSSSMANLGTEILSQLELSISNLNQRGVTGEPITLLTQMQESARAFVADAQAAQAHFERHIATQDTVLADDTLAGTVANTYVGSRS